MPYLDIVGMMDERKPYAYLGREFALDARDYASFATPVLTGTLGAMLGGLVGQRKSLGLGLGVLGGLAVPLTVFRTEVATRILTLEEIAADGCVSCLPLNEGEGEWAHDISGHGNDGHLGAGNPIHMPAWIEDENGKGLEFDDDYIEIAHSPSLSITNGITVEMVLKFAQSTGRSQIAVSKRYNIKPFWTWWVRDADRAVQWQIASATAETGMSSVPSYVSWGQCYRIVVTQEGNQGKIFFNGQPVDTGGVLSISIAETNNSNSILIGKSAGFAIRGRIYEFRLYNRALTPDELMAHELGDTLLRLPAVVG